MHIDLATGKIIQKHFSSVMIDINSAAVNIGGTSQGGLVANSLSR
jgi:hypothetical protein